MFEICKEVSFSGAHSIKGHPGKCSRSHGHNWRVRLHVQCAQLDRVGIGMDFGDVKQALCEIIGEFDHRDLDQLPPFAESNPTAENLAKYIFEQAATRINGAARRVSEVEVWETESCSVSYRS